MEIISFGNSKRVIVKANDTPGPGTYDTRSKSFHGPKYTAPGRKPDPNDPERFKNTPGPAAYNPSVTYSSSIKKSTFGYSMPGRSKSALRKSNEPGPGAYELRDSLEKPSYRLFFK